MASRMKEDEKNEKIIRNLLKLAPNRRCINCNSLGPQYVCTSFWTFVCTTCSGIHREFTHRVKSVSMAKFTSQEVSALQAGGNQRAKEIYFKEWDPQRHLLPDSSNVDRLRDFIKHVYVDKRYSGDRAVDRPPKGKVDDRDDAYENRRPDSYRAESRSPPYEDQYGDRRYADRPGPGDRRVELERGRYDDRGYNDRTSRYGYDEKRSPGRYEPDRSRYDRGYQDNRRHDDTYRRSPGHFESAGDRRFEDRFGNGSQNRRFEDRRLPEGPDRRRMEERSPNYQKDFGIGSPPPVRPVRDILGDDVPTLRVGDFPRANGSRDVEGSARSQVDGRKEFHTQRTTSSSSMGSVDGSSPSLKRANSGSLIDFLAEPEVPTATIQDPFATASSVSQPSTAVQHDLFAGTLAPQPSTAVQQDPFAGTLAPQTSKAVQQDPFAGTLTQQPSSTSGLGNSGWATFDLAPHPTPAPAPAPASAPAMAPAPATAPATGQGVLNLGQPSGILDSFGQASGTGQWTAVQQVQGTMPFASSAYNWSTISQPVQQPNGVSNSQSWNGLLSSTMLTPPTASQNVQPAQSMAKQVTETSNIGTQQGQNSAGSTRNGIKEIPEDLFKPAHAEPVLHGMGLQMGSQFGGVSGVQFPSVGMSLPGSMPYYVQPSKSKNPFDVLGEPPTAQSSTFPSMGSLQAALPNFNAGPVSARDSGLGALNTQWTSPNVPMSYPPAATPGIYLGQQLPHAMPPKVQSGAPSTMGSFPTGSFSGDDLFSNFGGPVLPSQSSLSSVGGNPFG